jgi:hypothetical protein
MLKIAPAFPITPEFAPAIPVYRPSMAMLKIAPAFPITPEFAPAIPVYRPSMAIKKAPRLRRRHQWECQ